MEHLIGRTGTITFEKPLRAPVPDIGTIGRVLAVHGTIASVANGFVAISVDTLYFHPDDAPTEDDAGLSAYDHGGAVHVPVGMIQGVVE